MASLLAEVPTQSVRLGSSSLFPFNIANVFLHISNYKSGTKKE